MLPRFFAFGSTTRLRFALNNNAVGIGHKSNLSPHKTIQSDFLFYSGKRLYFCSTKEKKLVITFKTRNDYDTYY